MGLALFNMDLMKSSGYEDIELYKFEFKIVNFKKSLNTHIGQIYGKF